MVYEIDDDLFIAYETFAVYLNSGWLPYELQDVINTILEDNLIGVLVLTCRYESVY